MMRAVAGAAVARAVEIDDVHPIGAVVAILGEQCAAAPCVVAGFGREVALQQPHAASALQVDGGNQAHDATGCSLQCESIERNSAAARARLRRSARDEIARRRNFATATQALNGAP